jgi:tryptophanyl-tRNA synthetase
LQDNVLRLLSELLASGLEPERCVLYIQSHVPEIAELYLYLNMLSYTGELERTATFKDKVRQQPDNVNAGLLTYPVLQAADILVHRALKIPVGKDQEQHIEMTRNFAERFNHRYGEVFPIPTAFTPGGGELKKIMSLDGSGKMSKSENHMNTIYLADDDELILQKIKKAKSDVVPAEPNAQKTPAVENLFGLLRLVSENDVVEKFEADFNSCVIRYGDMKKQLGEDMVKFVAPLREKARAFRSDEKYLREVMALGAEKARNSAKATMELVRSAMGLKYF